MALAGIRVLELAGLAPSPFAGMLLSDFGASVIRVDRMNPHNSDSLDRGKRSIALNLKSPEGVSIVRNLSTKSDVLIEPFRPGVMEKMGLGPDRLLGDNPGLIYCRMSGYGQKGPMHLQAGHDINYIATSGVLSALSWGEQKPNPPVNLLADFAGGGLMAAFGILTALIERSRSGKGQVIDANLVHGSAYVSSFLFCYRSIFPNPPGRNPLDGGAPFYDTYVTKDGKHVALGALEPQFYSVLLKGLKLDPASLPPQMDMSKWPRLRNILSRAIAQYTRDELTAAFADDHNSCVTPVLSMVEAAQHPHNQAIGVFGEDAHGRTVPNPAPRLERTPGALGGEGKSPRVGEHSRAILRECGYSSSEVDHLVAQSVVMDTPNSKL